MISRFFMSLVACALVAMSASACNSGPVSLPDAKFPIPVPPDASLVETSHALTGESFSPEFRTVSWTLKSSRSLEDIVAFYKAELPEAEEGTTDDGETFLTMIPAGAKKREKVMIFFYSNDRIYISQDTLM